MLFRGIFLVLILFVTGCATAPGGAACSSRPFNFQTDTFAYRNETVWVYGYDAEGNWVGTKRKSQPEYSLRCVSMARAARQFFDHAEFRPDLPPLNDADLRKRIRRIMWREPGAQGKEDVLIPGYDNLRELSATQEKMLKSACGGAWRSYFQRGNWRMPLPFSRRHQAGTAAELTRELDKNCPPILHAVSFPNLALNHTIVVFDRVETGQGTIFVCYDPNQESAPIYLYYDTAERRFYYPLTNYFPGGRVNVYRIYKGPFL